MDICDFLGIGMFGLEQNSRATLPILSRDPSF